MFNELFEEEDPFEESIRIINKVMQHLSDCKYIFFTEPTGTLEEKEKS
jgi:hypothetical protein